MTDATGSHASEFGSAKPGSDRDGSQALGTHWQRFFRADRASRMDTFDHAPDEPRSSTGREWEVFCREQESEPLTHVGSVSAPTAAVAREQASTLFGHAAAALWLCPADETVRVQASDLGVGRATPEGADGTAGATGESPESTIPAEAGGDRE